MEIKLKVVDQAIQEDPTFGRYFDALQKMVDRMMVSHFKYGRMDDKYPHSANGIDNVDKRSKMYRKSGNTEDMLDAANFAIIEYALPSHSRAHFRAQTAEESPGLVYGK